MNKRIFIPAIISTVLQISLLIIIKNQLFNRDIRTNLILITVLFYIISIPYTIYYFVKKEKETIPYKRTINILGTLFTLPIIFISLFIYFGPHESQIKEIEVEDIHLHTSDGREVNITHKDSIFKDTGNIARVRIDEAK